MRPEPVITPTKLAWMAGIVDYKGRVIRKNNKDRKNTPQIVLAVQCKELAILRALGELTGTSPEMMKPKPLSEIMRTGCLQHCPTKHVHAYGDLFMPAQARWTISGAALHTVLASLMPYLVVDRGYPELIAEIVAATPLSGRGSAAPMARCAQLMHLGWPIPDPYREVLESRLQAALATVTKDLEDADEVEGI